MTRRTLRTTFQILFTFFTLFAVITTEPPAADERGEVSDDGD